MVQIDIESLRAMGLGSSDPIVVTYTPEQDDAFLKVQRLASVRERASKEVCDRLVRDGFLREDAEVAVQRAVDCGLIDDMRFADVLIRSRLSQGKGVPGIIEELDALGINIAEVPGWPDEYVSAFPEAQTDRALQLLRRRPTRSKNIRAGAYRKLIASGYSPECSRQASLLYEQEVLGRRL